MYLWITIIMLLNTNQAIEILLEDKDQFIWYFEGAGTATIEEVGKEKDGAVFTEYLYYSGNERRTGKNILIPAKQANVYSGTWLTISDNGNRYEGELSLTFRADGTAEGFWTWKGVPGKLKIELKRKSERP